MLANFFGKSKPVNYILIVILFVVQFVLFLIVDNFKHFIESSIIEKVSAVIIVLIFLSFYNFIVTKNRLTLDNSFAFLLLVLFVGITPNFNYDLLTIVESTLLLFFLRKMYSLKTNNQIYEKIFDSGFWLGILFILEPIVLLFALFIYAAILLFLKLTIRTILIPIIGFITPILLYSVYCFYFDELFIITKLFSLNVEMDFSQFDAINFKISSFVIIGITMIAILVKTGKIVSVSNLFKRSWILLLFHLLLTLFYVFSQPRTDNTSMLLIYIPASIIVANWIQSIQRKFIVNGILIFLLVYAMLLPFIA